MRKTATRKAGSLLQNFTIFVVLLPVLLLLGLGVVPGLGIGSSAAGGARLSMMATLIVALLVVASLMIIFRGWIKTALVVIIVAGVGLTFVGGGDSGPKRMFLEMGGRGAFSTNIGTDVFCNGVHLGKTPFTISREDFEQKVELWDVPPRQERVDIDLDYGADAPQWAKYTWVPGDVFQQYDVWPYDTLRYSAHSGAKVNEAFKSSRYWWHFAKDGHTGLRRVGIFGGGASGHGNVLTIRGDVQPEFPALEPHVSLMLDALRLNDYQPTEEWIEYFLKHKDILFLQFEGKPHCQAALKAAVRRDFNLPETPTAEDCDRVLEIILDRAEERGGFQIPSFESMAMDLMGQTASPAVVRRFKEEMHAKSRGGYGGHSRSGKIEVRYRSGSAARLLPLEYAAKHLRPPELFAPLIYEYAHTGRYFDIVASYGTTESSRILSKALRLERGGRRGRFDKRRLLEQLSSVSSPRPEDYDGMLRFIQENAGGTFEKHHARRFIEANIDRPEANQDQLAKWVYHWSPFDEQEKMDLIARIPSSQTYHYMRMFQVHVEKNKREELISHLANYPNPSLDQFIIETYEWYRSERGPGYWHNSVSEALVKTNTPVIRAFVTERIEKGGEGARFLLRVIASAKADLSGLNWMVPTFEKMENPAMRQNATQVLQRINSRDSRALLEKWAHGNDKDVAATATAALAEIHAQRDKAIVRQKQYADLLAGRITPDDLLPHAQPWVWNGSEYVPEVN